MTARFRVEYLMEAALLGIFMISACAFTVLLDYPSSPVRLMVPDAGLRRLLTGLAMGGTAVSLIYSPWGMQSGAHFNPATTLTFFRLGKVRRRDALGYVGAQFAGAAAGVWVAWTVLGPRLADPATHFAATVPGPSGIAVAFLAEAVISFLLMSVILRVSNHGRFARYTGLCAGILVALFITVEAPLSGMSMNPARTLGSALFARDWTALWIYFLAPPAGMLAAAELYLRRRGREAVFCAKLHHQNRKRCIFCEARRPVAAAETFSSLPALQPPMTRSHSFPHTPGE
ncbi:MAG TPA: aquaporin [Gemmatimonadales bacterium]|nr:aquaporin [Gemmatimonadales bacterium]